MRESIVQFFNKTITLRYTLPNGQVGKSDWTTISVDCCYAHTNDNDVAKIIYESIIDYAFNDAEIEEAENLDELQTEAVVTRVRFEDEDSDGAQEKYGLYGEVIFNILLRVLFRTKPIIAKGFFYNILKPEENKGYDSFHIIKSEKSIGLWFGEMKFHQRYRQAVDSVYENITKALSNDYFRDNLLAILPQRKNMNIDDETVDEIMLDLKHNPKVIIADLQQKYNLRLVYPICIMCNKKTDYDTTIAKTIDYINAHPLTGMNIDLPLEMFFIFLPIDDAKTIKQTVIQWIKSSQPLTLL